MGRGKEKKKRGEEELTGSNRENCQAAFLSVHSERGGEGEEHHSLTLSCEQEKRREKRKGGFSLFTSESVDPAMSQCGGAQDQKKKKKKKGGNQTLICNYKQKNFH